MAEGFDKSKADLKQMLKMNEAIIPQNEASHHAQRGSKNVKKTRNLATAKRRPPAEDPQFLNQASHTSLSDSNGNALLSPVIVRYPSSSESDQHSPRGYSHPRGYNSVVSVTDQNPHGYSVSENKKTSPYKSRQPENSEMTNEVSVKKIQELKNGKASKESKILKNGRHFTAQSSPRRNVSASNGQKKNEQMKKNMQEAESVASNQHSEEKNSVDTSCMQINDGRNQEQMPVHEQNRKVNHYNRPVRLGDLDLPSDFLVLLEEHKIHLLRKKSLKFPNAKFFCHLCDYHLDVKEDCDKHMKDTRHCRRKEINEADAILKSLPSPTENQIAAVTVAIDKMYEEHGIDTKDKEDRMGIVCRLEKTVKEHIPDVVMSMYGSSLTCFGLKIADINVNLTSTDKDKKLTSLLKEVYTVLVELIGSGFSNVMSNFLAKVPSVRLQDDLSGLTVNIAIHCYSAHCSSEYLAIYSDFDDRVKKLAVAFRYWAYLCGLDRQCDGLIPPQAFNIMVIYFLQCITPQVVPIIKPPKVTGEEVGDFQKDAHKFEKMRVKVMNVSMSSRNTMSLGDLWLRLLRFYCLEFDTHNRVVSIRSAQELSRNTKPWNSKKLAVEDPFMLKKNITRMTNNSSIYEYWQDSIRKALYYFGVPRNAEGKSYIPIQALKKIVLESRGVCKKTVNEKKDKLTDSVHSRSAEGDKKDPQSKEVESDEGYNKKDPHSKEVELGEGDRKKDPQSKEGEAIVEEEACFTAVIAPNPLLLCRILPASRSSQRMSKPKDSSSNEPQCLSDVNSSMPALTDLSASDNTDVHKHPTSSSSDIVHSSYVADSAIPVHNTESSSSLSHNHDDHCCKESTLAGSGDNADSLEEKNNSVAVHTPSNITSGTSKEHDGTSSCHIVVHNSSPCETQRITATAPTEDDRTLQSEATTKSSVCDAEVVKFDKIVDSSIAMSKEDAGSSVNEDSKGTVEVQKNALSALVDGDCHYEFSKKCLADGKGPILVCTYCEKEGHLKNACPDYELPEILPLPPLTDHHITVLSETLNKVPDQVGLNEQDLEEREQFMKDLEEFIQAQFPDAKLALFGSSCNGFGFEKSDMDICLTFTKRKVTNKAWLIDSLARKMKEHRDLTNIQAIPTAKVPIVKFTVKRTGLEGDISLYNILAQENTRLLLCYSKIDPRVSVLGYTIKTFAKVCDIGDASRGSLSSYAYILMMLYYLQQVDPPVIPVLQELYKDKKKPENMIEGWDAWFMDDLTQLDELWPEKGKNEMSVAELWLGFLRFYVEQFSYKEYVVSIRQKELLSRFEKMWNGPCIAIEDPFDLTHNLGSGLTRRMNNFIFKTFINGRMLYGNPIDENMEAFNKYENPSDYFFHPDLLSDLRPPNVRGCRRCGKIGHNVKNCPTIQKERKEEQKKQQEQQQQLLQQNQQEPQQQVPSILTQEQQALQLISQSIPRQSNPKQNRKPFQPRQQTQQLRQNLLHRMHLPEQQQQNQMYNQHNEREILNRHEQDRRQSEPAANLNRNMSAAGLPFGLANHPNWKPVIPSTLRGFNPQAFHGANFPHFFAQQQQQFSHRGLQPNDPMQVPPPYLQHSARLNTNASSSAPPRALPPSLAYYQGYPQVPSGCNSWPPENNMRRGQYNQNYNQNGPQAVHSPYLMNYISPAGFQNMNIRAQNMFVNANGPVLDASKNHLHRHK